MTTELNEERMDVIGQNGNDGLHYDQAILTVRLDDISTTEEMKDLFKLIFTIFNKSPDVVTELTAGTDYFELYPNLKAIAKESHVENTTA